MIPQAFTCFCSFSYVLGHATHTIYTTNAPYVRANLSGMHCPAPWKLPKPTERMGNQSIYVFFCPGFLPLPRLPRPAAFYPFPALQPKRSAPVHPRYLCPDVPKHPYLSRCFCNLPVVHFATSLHWYNWCAASGLGLDLCHCYQPCPGLWKAWEANSFWQTNLFTA